MAVKVKDGLFFGDAESSQDINFLEQNTITYFINCAGFEVSNAFSECKYLTFWWSDDPKVELFDSHGVVLNQISDFINNALCSGESVLIFCNDGRNRSVATTAAYLMETYLWGLNKTMDFIISKCYNAGIKPELLQQLANLDWKFQRQRLHEAYALDPDTRNVVLEVQLRKLLDWQQDPFEHDIVNSTDVDADERLMVNSFLNGRMTIRELPPPAPVHDDILCENDTHGYGIGVRWIDRPLSSHVNGPDKGPRSVVAGEPIQSIRFFDGSDPIIQSNQDQENF